MGSAQSKRDFEQLQDTFDIICGHCPCQQTRYQKSDAGQRLEKGSPLTDTNDGSASRHSFRHLLEERLKSRNRVLAQVASSNGEFSPDLGILHRSSSPYLGISTWEPINLDDSGHESGMNMLDISMDGGVGEFQRLHQTQAQKHSPGHTHPDTVTVTPPRHIKMYDYTPKSPAFLLQKTISYSSPKLKKIGRCTTGNSSDTSASASSVLTRTTTSSVCNSARIKTVETKSTFTRNGQSGESGNTTLFVPRRLFDRGEEVSNAQSITDDESENEERYQPIVIETSQHERDWTMTTTSSEGLNDADTSSPPPPPRTPPQTSYSSTPSNSIDQSIVIRNGVLVKETLPPSPSPLSHGRIPSSCSSDNHANGIPDGTEKDNMRYTNTLPSFKKGRPIKLKIQESYAGFTTENVPLQNGNENDMNISNMSLLSDLEQAHFFSYDPYFSLGQYNISTLDGGQYGNGLSVKMGERYMTLQDRNERVWCIMRSRHTWIPSAVIYSPKARYVTQIPSSHRPCSDGMGMGKDGDGDGVELYPWALVKKHGRRMDHDVSIHMVAKSGKGASSELVGGLFEKRPEFRSRHGFDENGNHQHTIVSRVTENRGDAETEIPCCMMVRDPVKRDLFEVTISPGIDPLMIICYMAVHSKMDVEPKLSDL